MFQCSRLQGVFLENALERLERHLVLGRTFPGARL